MSPNLGTCGISEAVQAAALAASSGDLADRLRSEGYLVCEGVLRPEICDALREHILVTAEAAKAKDRADLFGNIQEQDNRFDLKLDLCPPVVEALNSYGARCGGLLEDVCGGRTRIVELAAITSSKGAVAQPVHADTMHGVTRFLQSDLNLPTREENTADSDEEGADEDVANIIQTVATDTALIFTALAALQDVEADMGPTHVWPATHTVEHHATLWGTNVSGKLSVDEADKAFGVNHRKMTLKKGDLVLYDSRTMHCGGANASDKRRSVFCISCMGPGIRPDGTTWTLLSSLRNQLVLGELPLPASASRAPANTEASDEVQLPLPPAKSRGAAKGGYVLEVLDEDAAKKIPPLAEWMAAVSCTLCRRWRPCSEEEAPRLTSSEPGFTCPVLGYSCMQEQGYTNEEIDALF